MKRARVCAAATGAKSNGKTVNGQFIVLPNGPSILLAAPLTACHSLAAAVKQSVAGHCPNEWGKSEGEGKAANRIESDQVFAPISTAKQRLPAAEAVLSALYLTLRVLWTFCSVVAVPLWHNLLA